MKVPGKRVPSQLSNEELAKLLEEAKDETVEELEYHNDVLAFLHFYGIEPGVNKVSKTMVQRLYRQWSEDPISNNLLGKELARFLASDDRSNYHLINKKSFQLAASSYKYLKTGTKDKIKRPLYRKHFDKFLEFYGFKKGRAVWVPSFVLYYWYDKWTYNNKTQNPLSEFWFYQFCSLNFNRKRPDGTAYYYQLSESFFNTMSKEKMLEMIESRNNHVKQHRKRQKRQKKERVNKVSKS